jgi:competence protein CoiA
MMYADTHLGRVEASPGLTGTCPPCGHPCRPRCGQVNVHHWAHHARADCDPWSESESAWHRGWKLAVPAERREVIIGRHRADVVTASGGVVELQHSAISPDVIEAREQFYGERMAWIFDVAGAFTAGRLTSTHRRTKATPRT